MQQALTPCPSCRRHVRAGDQRCPFCSATMAGSNRIDVEPSRRLTRAGIFFFASTVAGSLAVTGCGGKEETTSTGDTGVADSKGDVTDSGGPGPVYGAPIDSGTDTTDTGGPVPPYGAPPADSGIDARDGGDTGGGGAIYGAAPFK